MQTSLKITGQSIQTRLDNFINQLPAEIKNHPLVQNLTKDLTVSIEKLLQTSIKSILQDTGVALEAKLKVIADLFQQMEQSKQPAQPQPDLSPIKNDLKAKLLQMKQLSLERGEDLTKGITTKAVLETKEGTISLQNLPIKNAVGQIDGLLKDIETFQLLSKTTDSFYTFLPVGWRELRDGEIAFKQERSSAKGTVYSCRLNLDLERFGRLSIIVMVHNRVSSEFGIRSSEFYVSFKADSPEFQTIISSHTDELQESFRQRGLNLKAVNVLDIDDASLEQLEKFESPEKIISIKA